MNGGASMNYDIDEDARWFSTHRDELAQKYNGKTIAVRNGVVLAVGFDIADLASKVDLPVGEYLIQTCLFGRQTNTVHIYTPGLVTA
jgi:hypothetical protein